MRASGHASRPGTLSVVTAAGAPPTLVLFPGDISTARDAMLGSPDLAEWNAWSCEDLAELLSRRWPEYHACVVHPPRSVDGFSCYDHWLTSLDATGDPVGGYDGSGSACAHLLTLLLAVPELSASPLHLIAFSKGAVVLNQIVAEMGGSSDSAQDLCDRVNSYVWLDPGLNREPGPILLGGQSDASLLHSAAQRMRKRKPSAPRLSVALTPYQLQPRSWLRSWKLAWSWPPLRRESEAAAAQRNFAHLVRAEGLDVRCERYLTDRPASLDNHFGILDAFAAPWDAS